VCPVLPAPMRPWPLAAREVVQHRLSCDFSNFSQIRAWFHEHKQTSVVSGVRQFQTGAEYQ
jgi:hypothetical protein